MSPRANVANNRVVQKRKSPASDPMIKGVIAVTKAEEKAVNRLGQIGRIAIAIFQNMSRSLLGVPTRRIAKGRTPAGHRKRKVATFNRRPAAWRSESKLTSRRAA